MSDSLQPHGLYSPWNSPGQNTDVGSLSLVQQIFLTQESNRGLLHCRRILYHLCYQNELVNFGKETNNITLQHKLEKYFKRNLFYLRKNTQL